ncbi:MAG: hypothetical protein IPK62_04715 [Bacteroidetes bacterium]|nr:hypothetical protein [Bacteroidota bacterium]
MKCRILSVIIGMAFMHPVFSQSLLSSTVTLHAKNQPLHEVLTIISNESNINFFL